MLKTTISDDEVITRVLHGEKNLYEKIIRKYNPRLYRIAMSIVKDADEAEEIMQLAYIKAYENLSKFEGKSSFSTWITRILINEGLQNQKKRTRFEPMDTEENMKNIHTTDTKTPLGGLLNNELKELLESSVEQLPDKYRMVFIMREIENMSIAETMECTNLSESNVKVRLNRAKDMLRNTLSQYYKSEEIYGFHLTRCNKMVLMVMKHVI